MRMVTHFGVQTSNRHDGLKLTRDNYVKVNNKSSFAKGLVYNDNFIKKHKKRSLYNYDLNMKYFSLLSKREFNNELMRFVKKAEFKEITNLAPLKVSGYYIMVLDEYSQVYIGRSKNIRQRIQHHWRKQKEFDRLIFGNEEDSILSIDSFRAYDTTRIFVHKSFDLESYEDDFINMFNKKYILNRTIGGTLEGGLAEAIANAKTRELPIKTKNRIQKEDYYYYYEEIKKKEENRIGILKKREQERINQKHKSITDARELHSKDSREFIVSTSYNVYIKYQDPKDIFEKNLAMTYEEYKSKMMKYTKEKILDDLLTYIEKL